MYVSNKRDYVGKTRDLNPLLENGISSITILNKCTCACAISCSTISDSLRPFGL